MKQGKCLPLLCFALAVVMVCQSAWADLFVISNRGTRIEAGDIRDIYSGEKNFAGTLRLQPVDNGLIQHVFLATVLQMDAGRYYTIWTKKSFREGHSPPPVKSGDAAVIEFVRNVPGAIGYVTTQPSGVHIIQKF